MSVHSLTTAPINVYSKTYWQGFILAMSQEAAHELGLQNKINPEATTPFYRRGWKPERFSPNILQFIAPTIDFSKHTHYPAAPARRKDEKESLEKYRWIGPPIAGLGAFLSALSWKSFQRCHATLSHTATVRSRLQNLHPYWTPIKTQLERIVQIKLKVDEIRYKIFYRYFFASLGVFAGGGLLTLGGFAKVSLFVTSGWAVLAVAAVWAMFSAGLHWQDKQDIRKLYGVVALDPERLADTILFYLHRDFQENMVVHISSSPSIITQYPQFFLNQEPIARPSLPIPGGYQVDGPVPPAYPEPSAPYEFD